MIRFFNSRNLDVYSTKLRDYLKADKSIDIITIKGIGYQFTMTNLPPECLAFFIIVIILL